MKRVLTAVVLVPLVLLAVFRAPIWLFVLLVAVVIVLALHEYLNIAEAAGIKPFRWLTYVLGVLPIVMMWGLMAASVFLNPPRRYAAYPSINWWFLTTRWSLLLLTPVIFGIPLVFRKDLRAGLASVASSVFGLFYISASLCLLIEFRSLPFEATLIIFVLFSVWAGDIAAYYVGRSIGRHKLAPIVSPNKSWEGAVASVIASVAVAFAVLHFVPVLNSYFVPNWMYGSSGWAFYTPTEQASFQVPLVHAVVLGILTNVAAQFGDLFESALKRGANVKDSGTLLPGHGGVLDRIDALLFAIPVVWYYAQLTGFLQPQSSQFYK